MVTNFIFGWLVNLSIYYFCASDDVAVVSWLGALDVSPGTLVPVSTVPSSSSMFPMDVTGFSGW